MLDWTLNLHYLTASILNRVLALSTCINCNLNICVRMISINVALVKVTINIKSYEVIVEETTFCFRKEWCEVVISAECALCTSPCFYCFQIHQGETTAGTLLFAGTLGNISSDSLLCSIIISFLIKVSMSCLNSLITNRCTLALWWSTAFF